MKKQFTPSWDLFNKSLTLVREHYLAVIYLVLLPGLLNSLANLMVGVIDFENGVSNFTQMQILGSILLALSLIWQIVNVGPLTYFTLQAVAGKKPATLSTYYREGLRFTPRLVLYYLIFGALLLGGLLLFIVPAFFVLRRYALGSYYLVDMGADVGNSLKISSTRSKAASKAIWGTVGVSLAIILLAAFAQAIFSSVGLLLSELIACTTVFLFALRYRDVEPSTPKL